MRQRADKPYRVGLALSGGGAKGFAHLGAFRLFEECGVKPDIISGVSAGAIAGSLWADGYAWDEIKELFKGKDFSEFAQFQLPKAGLFDHKRLRSFLSKHLRAKRIEDLPIPMVIVATDLDKGVSHEFRSGPLADAVLASSSVPIIFSPVEIDGNHYVDGGVFRNFPVTNIREECDRVIGVNLTPLIREEYKQTILYIAERTYHYMFRANTLEDRQLCDLLIETTEFAQYKMFDLENVDLIADLGYEAALNALGEPLREGPFETIIANIKEKRKQLESAGMKALDE